MAAVSETGFLVGALEGVLGAKAVALVPERPNGPMQINGEKTSAFINPCGQCVVVELSYLDLKSGEDIQRIGLVSPKIRRDPLFPELILEDVDQSISLSPAGEVVFRKISN